LNLNEGYWSNPVVGGYCPPQRCFFGMAGNQNETYGQILILGGKTYDKDEGIIYILSELSTDPNDNEAWGVVNEKEKEREQEAIRKMLPSTANMAKKDSQNVQVTKITLEISEADKIINDQKKQIGELEGVIKNTKHKNTELEERKAKLKAELESTRVRSEEDARDLELSKVEKIKRNEQNRELNEKLKVLLAYEIKKRKLLERKTAALQNTMRRSENLIISIDAFYNKCVKDNLLNGIIKEDALFKCDTLKSQHKDALFQFKQNYELIFEKEKKYKSDLKEKVLLRVIE